MSKPFNYLTSFQAAAIAVVIAVSSAGGVVIAQDSGQLSKFLLLKLSREQSQVLCTSAIFTSCMDFSEQVCLELSEKAVQQCLMPLPDTINLGELDNDVLESCPQGVYSEAGYAESKAAECLQKAFEG